LAWSGTMEMEKYRHSGSNHGFDTLRICSIGLWGKSLGKPPRGYGLRDVTLSIGDSRDWYTIKLGNLDCLGASPSLVVSLRASVGLKADDAPDRGLGRALACHP
jgi:hypothetical protein